ncbi:MULTISPECIES: cation/cationic drug transporter [unclassified Paenibacillus]|uniref:cation/cationic drug transporter n=1 Tax=unclassified Paenibacillus TaxID=185978 RepID=UPI0036415DD2
MTYFFIFISILLGAFAQILMKIGTGKAETMIKIFLNPYVMSGLVLYGLSAITWIFAISKVQLSFAYPMVSLGYVLVFVLSYFVFKEPIGILRCAGLLTIVAGVVMISKS